MRGSSVAPLSIALAALALTEVTAAAGNSPAVEVFTIGELPIVTDSDRHLPSTSIEVYEIDGVERYEVELSQGLPSDPDAARRIAEGRIGQMNEARMERMRRAALGLSRAMQYGIDRYPAIVVDRRAVVYGVTDIEDALGRYRAWLQNPAR